MTPAAPPVEVEILDAPQWAAADEPVRVALVVRRPSDRTGAAELVQIAAWRGAAVDVDADLFERGVALGPGEAYRCTIRVRFTRPGPADLACLFVQAADAASRHAAVNLPAQPVRVVPSLAREVAVKVTRVCGYELGAKIGIEVTHIGSTRFDDFEAALGPDSRVRAGVSEHRRQAFEPGDVIRFDAVMAGAELELGLDAVVAGERVGPVRRGFTIPPSGGEDTPAPFRFMEPRRLTRDRVALFGKGDGREVPAAGGAFAVAGGGAEYLAVINPSDPRASKVVLHAEVGRVGVTGARKRDDGGWEFPLTVVADPTLTKSVRLYYDVVVPGHELRGELYLSVRPTWGRHSLLALTLGIAVTAKGLSGLASAAVNQDGAFEDLLALLLSPNARYAASIPALFVALRLLDGAYRRFSDD